MIDFVDVQYDRSAICLDLVATLRILRRLSSANVDSLANGLTGDKPEPFSPVV